MKTYKGFIGPLEPHQIIVFGSNPQGIHGAGAAKIALEHFGAKYGKGRGFYGQSYALVTKNLTPFYYEVETELEYEQAGPRSVSLRQIQDNIMELYAFALNNPDKEFFIAYSDSNNNLNGYTAQEMANVFNSFDIPDNIVFNEDFAKLFV